MVYEITTGLPEADLELLKEKQASALIVTDSREALLLLKELGFGEEWELLLAEVYFCKVEAEQEYFCGSLAIPNAVDLLGSRYRLLFFINKQYVLLVSEDGYGKRLSEHLRSRKLTAQTTTEKVLSMILADIIAKDNVILEKFERELMEMEEEAMRRQTDLFLKHMIRVRKQLLTLRGYYEQFMEVCRELEENENDLFAKKQLKYFGNISDRAERLLHRCIHLIDYAGQVKDVYQGQVDARQNRNMQYLTVVSTIFFPLTLITGWYGMNFENMPELAHGYPYVVAISVLVVIICIWIFKKKKII
ncbi:MAG: CorA family divalent cation transporter [bacterium]|nr:CorA family divalent cation transporter [bacterium]MDY4098995.1 CorA family divalent cation transporter [Lachnospiraceae bacterium]